MRKLRFDFDRKFLETIYLTFIRAILEKPDCYEMDKTSISMFEILEPRGSALGKYSL